MRTLKNNVRLVYPAVVLLFLCLFSLAEAAERAAPGDKWNAALDALKRSDYAAALRDFKILAEQGDARAQYQLGQMYDLGKGVSQSHKEAAVWFREAAERGFTDAQFNLAYKYRKGEGVPKDLIKAYMWSNLAAAQGTRRAIDLRNSVARETTPAQIAEAERLLSEWQAKPQTAR